MLFLDRDFRLFLIDFPFISENTAHIALIVHAIFKPNHNYSGPFCLAPPPGLGIRPVNDAGASTSGQTGRKETAR
jgi:hypothetical protein